jgi:hypothetical protein
MTDITTQRTVPLLLLLLLLLPLDGATIQPGKF